MGVLGGFIVFLSGENIFVAVFEKYILFLVEARIEGECLLIGLIVSFYYLTGLDKYNYGELSVIYIILILIFLLQVQIKSKFLTLF